MYRRTLTAYLESEVGEPAVVDLVERVASACWRISELVRDTAIDWKVDLAVPTELVGDQSKQIAQAADRTFRRSCLQSANLGALVSYREMRDGNMTIADSGELTIVYDALDNPALLKSNQTVGSIFSIVRAMRGRELAIQDQRVEVAGYAVFGPSTMFVITHGKGVHGFTLDVSNTEFILTHSNIAAAENNEECQVGLINAFIQAKSSAANISSYRPKSHDPEPARIHPSLSIAAETHRRLMQGRKPHMLRW